jgi:DNA repair protein RadC
MFNLIAATRRYWKKLDDLEAAYKRGEVSLEEVDARVSELMQELGQERRETFHVLIESSKHLWNQQREVILGVAFLGIVTYAWLLQVL